MDIIRPRLQAERWPAKNAMVGSELEKPAGEYRAPLAEMKSGLIKHHMVAGCLQAHPHTELSPSARKFLQAQPLKVI
jgi:hypothetical protein